MTDATASVPAATTANAADVFSLTVADVRLIDNAVCAGELPSLFLPFLAAPGQPDLECRLTDRGPDPTLDAEPPRPEAPWEFTAVEEHCGIIYRNREGRALWRISADIDFERPEFYWSPGLFKSCYGSHTLCWTRALATLQFTFRLRTAGGLVFHAMAADIDGGGLLCAGPSGVGKSTISRLLHAAGHLVLTDERPVVRRLAAAAGGGFMLHATPWQNMGGMAAPGRAPLRCICFLRHGAENLATPLANSAALRRLIHVSRVPWQHPLLFDPCLKTFESLLAQVPVYDLAFRPDASVIPVLRELASGAPGVL